MNPRDFLLTFAEDAEMANIEIQLSAYTGRGEDCETARAMRASLARFHALMEGRRKRILELLEAAGEKQQGG